MTSKTKKTRAAESGVSAKGVAIGVAAGLGTVAALALGLFGLSRRVAQEDGEHPAPDLAADAAPVGTERAPEAFRPDPTAPVPDSMRESLRPATGPAPSIAANRGEMANQTASANA